MEAAGPQWSWSSCSSVRSSSRAAARTPLKRSGPRAGEELRFATPKSCGGQTPQLALAGLRLFCVERFGSLRRAYERMDFHRDGWVSCLEFQEVLAGQERYCALQEARGLFCLLARGTEGWLSWEVFRRKLDGAYVEPQSQPTSPASSGGSESAGRALRALFQKRKEPGHSDADTAASVGSAATPSSGAGPPPIACRAQFAPSVRNGAAAEEALVPKPFAGRSADPEAGRSSLAHRILQGALRTSRSTPSSPKLRPERERAGGPTESLPLRRLDEGLSSLMGEVAALRALGGYTPGASPAQPAIPADAFLTPPRRPGGGSPSSVQTGGSSQALKPAWVSALPLRTQGRLAACASTREAMQVLDEAVDGEPDEAEASPEEVAAALALLQQAQRRLGELEEKQEQMRRRHQAELDALRDQLRDERRRSWKRLLRRLAPPGLSLAAHRARPAAPGSLASPLPTPRKRRKDAKTSGEEPLLVEQPPRRTLEPVTKAAHA